MSYWIWLSVIKRCFRSKKHMDFSTASGVKKGNGSIFFLNRVMFWVPLPNLNKEQPSLSNSGKKSHLALLTLSVHVLDNLQVNAQTIAGHGWSTQGSWNSINRRRYLLRKIINFVLFHTCTVQHWVLQMANEVNDQ